MIRYRMIVGWMLLMLLAVTHSAHAETELDLFVNEEPLSMQESVFVEEGRIFVPVREIAAQLEAEIVWNQDGNTFELTADTGNRLVFAAGDREVALNGETYWMDVAPVVHHDRIYLPARHLAEVLHASIRWDQNEGNVYIDTVPLYEVQPGETLLDIARSFNVPVATLQHLNDEESIYLYVGDKLKVVVPQIMNASYSEKPYSEEDLELLAKIIHVEAGYESMEGRIAVGNVILNRVEDERFPDTIQGVIYQPNQFPPATNGLMDAAQPDEDTVDAARRVLEGEVVADGALYFYNPNNTRSSSFFTRLDLVVEIGNHRFVK